MKVIIQCAGSKRKDAPRLKGPSGGEVVFVARPELCPRELTTTVRCCSPDEPAGPGALTWREIVVAYNQRGENPDALSSAANLYRPSIYRTLVSAFGRENVFILSAGWGLIRSDFLTPDYNITFSTQPKVPVWARRPKRLAFPLADLNHLSEVVISPDEPVHFFGGRDYLPLLQALTGSTGVRTVVHHKGNPPSPVCFEYEPFACERNQNWHYDAAEAFIRTAKT